MGNSGGLTYIYTEKLDFINRSTENNNDYKHCLLKFPCEKYAYIAMIFSHLN